MLNKRFLQLAAETKKIWSDEDWYPSRDRTWSEPCYPSTEVSKSHCGTCEIQNIHKAKGTISKIVMLVCYQACRMNEGLVLYYEPHDKIYRNAANKLDELGFEPLITTEHLGYLLREPDHGVFTMWHLAVTPADVKQLNELKCQSKARVQSAKARTPSRSTKTARNTVLAVPITNIRKGV